MNDLNEEKFKEKNFDLEEVRQKLYMIDSKLLKLIRSKFEILEKFLIAEKEREIKISDKSSLKEITERNMEEIKNKDFRRYLELALKDIEDMSREYIKFKKGISAEYVNNLEFSNKKIGYTGVPGSYAYEVLTNLIKNSGNTFKYDEIEKNIYNWSSHRELVQKVSSGEMDIGVIPIENSLVGEVRDSIDLINNASIYIIGEVKHKIEHNLLGIKGSEIENIKNVYSHEQAFLQCSRFLEKHTQWKIIKMSNTALSAKYIMEMGSVENACIANMKTKEMYNLDLLKEDINDSKENYTRFFVISNKNIATEESDKISIITSTRNEAGALMNLLKVFSDYNLNMVGLKSRPIINKPWKYYFYIDFEGSIKNGKVKSALEEIRFKSDYFQILGNYKVYNLTI
ncbi:bifunctional chorismate mutase/prephenate dehydratase [Leptotrichia sp. OH3620_COT-345]|uniref:bifunctional chorismate mutase/prephenate dehydratase n=1 Tax=Leptotrichia sp. OH3620_COT-345 TaxID=2491048 RepID=UPI001F2C7BB2|nr:prephenate dehydratase domain-containing protein [Leptotrichia sp. OH3620_COT-345]